LEMGKGRQANYRLKAQRLNGGWTQNDIVERMHRAALSRELPEPKGLDANYVSRWERGIVPHPYHAYLLCLAFESSPASLGLPAAELGLAAETGAYGTLRAEQIATNRRQFGKAILGSVVTGIGLTGSEPITETPAVASFALSAAMPGADSRSVELEAASVEHVAAVTFHLEQLRRRAPGDYLLRLVASHLSFIRSHLSSANGNTSGSVISAMGEAAVLAGRLSFWDIRDSSSTARYFQLASQAATEAANQALGAYVLAFTAEFMTYMGRPKEAIDYVGAAHRSRDALAPRVNAWVASVEAEAYAHLGQADSSRASLERAHHAMDRAGPADHEPAWIDFFDEARLAGYEGACLVRLEDAPGALAVLDRATRITDRSFTKYHSEIAADMAWAHAQQGSVDESCRQLALAFQFANPVGYRDGLRRISHVRQRLQPHRDATAVRELDELLVAHLSS
jgi:transcriptional regulator with XRE-family HTH domain/tetratricopeptide (TPR) repeat protein